MNKKIKILAVDDEVFNLKLLQELIEQMGYDVIVASDGEEALKKMDEMPDLILLDIMMPKLDGLEVLKIIKNKEITKNIPVVIITSLPDRESKIKAKELGADDFLTKPFDVTELTVRIRNLLKAKEHYDYIKEFNNILQEEVEKRTRELKSSYQKLKQANLDTIHRLSLTADYRDDETGKHIMRISLYSKLIAENLGLPKEEIELLSTASPMHDIGKIGIPDRILLKPGKLTKEEFEIMKTHAIIGSKILLGSDSELLKSGEIITLSHHEKFDGSGYPHNFKGEEIPLVGRIVALCDVFDALVSKRVYKPAFSKEQAFSILKESSGTHFDPEIIEAFFKDISSVIRIMETYKEEDIEFKQQWDIRG